MNNPDNFQLPRLEKRVLKFTIFIFWVTAYLVRWSSLWLVGIFPYLQANLPDSTVQFMLSMQIGLPFILAALLSAVVIYRLFRPHPRSVLLVAGLLGITLLGVLYMIIVVTSPFVKCGQLTPPPPYHSEQKGISGKESLVEDSSGSCIS
jgi:hypothetical protein